MSGKPAYVKPIHTLVSSSTRVSEQIKGRLLFVHSETLKSGSQKTIAVMADKDPKFALKSVLVIEAWSPADQNHLQQKLKPLEGKVVSLTNAKISLRGKTLVFFDSGIKCVWDTKTQVTECKEDTSYPTQLPALPNMSAVAKIPHVCMVSLVAAVAEEGPAQDRQVIPGKTKSVANLKVAIGDKTMAAAFWDGLSEKMGSATVSQVYRLDWVMLKQESPGKYALTSVAASVADLQEGEAASAVTDGLAAPADMVSMSTQYGESYEDKMKKPFAQGDLFSLEEIQSLQFGKPGVLLVPATYLLEARGMTAEMPNRSWYTGCTQCKKQLESVGSQMQCVQHGVNKGKKVYGGQLLLADLSHKKELAIWEDTLRRLVKDFLGHEDLDLENVMEDLTQAFKGIELVLRVGVSMRKDGKSVNLDLFDVQEQVTSSGCLAIYKEIKHEFGEGSPGIVPACCRQVTVNDLGQLAVKNDKAERSVETVKLMLRVIEDPALQVPDDIDGLEVTLRCSCVVCNQECMLYAAGLPKTVQVYTRMLVDEYVTAFVQTMEPDHKFPVGYHLSHKKRTDVPMDIRVFKWQVGQYLLSLSDVKTNEESDEKAVKLKRTKQIETLMTGVRSEAKRLRLTKTDDGSTV